MVSLDLDHVGCWTVDARGSAAYGRSTATSPDGSIAAMVDVYVSCTPADG